MYRFNSTINIKTRNCLSCGKPCQPFSRGRCADCARIEDAQARMNEETAKEIISEGLSDIVERLDDIYSKWLRLSHIGEDGKCECYTCHKRFYWTAIQTGHFKRRGNMLLRWDERNTKPQCEECNCYRDEREMLRVYAERLEKENAGIVSILNEEASIVFKPSRTDLNQMVLDYTLKFKSLKRR